MALRMPVIAIVGRPNVGKSTFFNRVIGERKSIVEDLPGVTRDRVYALVERYEIPFQLIDTGGLERSPGNRIAKMVIEQTHLAIAEADIVICLFDGQTGVHPDDSAVMDILRRTDKPIVYAANKCDDPTHAPRANDFFQLGCDAVQPLTSLHGKGAEELIRSSLRLLANYASLLQSAVDVKKNRAEEERAARAYMKAFLPPENEEEQGPGDDEIELGDDGEDSDEFPAFAPVYVPGAEDLSVNYDKEHKRTSDTGHQLFSNDETLLAVDSEVEELEGLPPDEEEKLPVIECIKLAIVGRPNVGKSTLLNTLVGEERAIVSDVAGTTRDLLDMRITREGQLYQIVDTAGLRKTGKVSDRIEQYSVMRALSALSESDVAVAVIDAQEGPTDQDAKIVGIAHEQGKGIVLVVNKWDLLEKDHKTVRQYDQRVRDAFKFAAYAPIVYTSAATGRRCNKIIEAAKEVAVSRLRRIPSGILNRTLRQAVRDKTLGFYRGRPIKLYYATQVDSAPPRFVLFFNQPKELHFSHLRYLKNVIRDKFGLHGCDLKIVGKKR